MTLFSFSPHLTTTEMFLNPKMPLEDRNTLLNLYQENNIFQNSVWISTSGSSGILKWVVLSKQALLTSAEAINYHLKSDASDIWLNPLPTFHVGGLGINYRGFLSGAKVIPFYDEEKKWDPYLFVESLNYHQATLTAIVPTQLFDLVKLNLKSPLSLRAIIVGGGALSESLYFQGIQLGWNLLPSYGLTECSSQVATASLESLQVNEYPKLTPLKHVKLKTNSSGFLHIQSNSLLTAYVSVNGVVDPKVDGWFPTEDFVDLADGDQFNKVHRGLNFVKISGECVDLLRLDQILESLILKMELKCSVALFPFPDERLGHVIHLAVVEEYDIQPLVDAFSRHVMPFEKIRQVHVVKEIPRSPLNKLLRSKILQLVNK